MSNKINWQDPVKEIMKSSEVIKTISWKDIKKNAEESEKRRKQEELDEQERIDSRPITCPLCKTIDRFDKFHNELRDDNDVCGPGYSSW